MAKIASSFRRFFAFIQQYTSGSIAAAIRRLIDNVVEGISESSNAFVKILLSLALIPLIILLAVVLVFRNFFRYVIRFLRFVCKWFKRLIVVTLEEINFYVERLARFSEELKQRWTHIYHLSRDVVRYLVDKIIDDNARFQSSQGGHVLGITGQALKATVLWFVWLLVTVIMGAVLTLTAVVLGPVLHRFLRGKIP